VLFGRFWTFRYHDSFKFRLILVDDELNPPAASLALPASLNPFSASTAIMEVGDKPEHAAGTYVMDIYDLRGRIIRSLSLDAISGVVS